MQPNATTLRMCSAAIAMLAACDLPSRELGTKRERWTILEPIDYDTFFTAVAVTADDDVVVFGDFPTRAQGLLRRYDAEGEPRWARSFVGEAREEFWAYDVTVAGDGTIVAAAGGYNVSGPSKAPDKRVPVAMLFGFDAGGTQRWERIVDGAVDATAVTALPDGSVAYGGSTIEGDGVHIGVISTAGVFGPLSRDLVGEVEYPVPRVIEIAAQSGGQLVAAVRRGGRVDFVGLDAALAPSWTRTSEKGFSDGAIAIAQDDTIWLLTRLDMRILGGDQSGIQNDNRLAVLAPDGTLERELEGIEPDLNPRAIAIAPDGTLVLAGSEAHDVRDYQLGIAEIDPETGETLWFDTAGRQGSDLVPYSEDGLFDLAITASGDLVPVGIYDDRASTGQWRGWLRRYAARLPEQP